MTYRVFSLDLAYVLILTQMNAKRKPKLIWDNQGQENKMCGHETVKPIQYQILHKLLGTANNLDSS